MVEFGRVVGVCVIGCIAVCGIGVHSLLIFVVNYHI